MRKMQSNNFFNKTCKINVNDLYEENEIIKEIRYELMYGTIDRPSIH